MSSPLPALNPSPLKLSLSFSVHDLSPNRRRAIPSTVVETMLFTDKLFSVDRGPWRDAGNLILRLGAKLGIKTTRSFCPPLSPLNLLL